MNSIHLLNKTNLPVEKLIKLSLKKSQSNEFHYQIGYPEKPVIEKKVQLIKTLQKDGLCSREGAFKLVSIFREKEARMFETLKFQLLKEHLQKGQVHEFDFVHPRVSLKAVENIDQYHL